MQEARALLDPGARRLQRRVAVDGLLGEVALAQPHRLAVEDVDRRVEDHARAPTGRRSPRSCAAAPARRPRTSRGGTARRRRCRARRRTRTARRSRRCRARRRRRRARPRRSARGRRPPKSPRPSMSGDAPREAHLVPADVRDLERRRSGPSGRTRRRAGRAPRRRRARRSARRAAASRGTGPSTGAPAARALDHQLVQPGGAQPLHGRGERAHAGHDEPVGGAPARRGRRSARRARRRAPAPSRRCGGCPCRSRRAPMVATASHHPVSVPFVDGTPGSVGSSADRRAQRAGEGLEAASIMWWAFVPASTRRCSVSRARVGHGAEELLGQLVAEAAGAARRQVGAEGAEGAAREVDRARRAAPRPSARRRGRSA